MINITQKQVIRLLLEDLEGVLSAEYSSDGNRVTAFVRGFLGVPLPEPKGESPHRLTDYWKQGKLAAEGKEFEMPEANLWW